MTLEHRQLRWIGLLLGGVSMVALSHDDTVGARYVDPDGINVSDCRNTTNPAAASSTRSRRPSPGNTVKVAAGIYDMSGVDARELPVWRQACAGRL